MKIEKQEHHSIDTLILALAGIWLVSIMINLLV